MNSYRELIVWQKAIDLVVETYRLIELLPNQERFSLCDQLRRSVVSVPSNIAEGYGRNAIKDYVRFLNIARGSICELETQLIISVRLGYLSETQTGIAMQMCDEIGRMLNTLAAKLTQGS